MRNVNIGADVGLREMLYLAMECDKRAGLDGVFTIIWQCPEKVRIRVITAHY